jgi:hypothetical protein
MILAYYRDAAGKITNCHEVKGIAMDDLQEKVEAYNSDARGNRTAYVVVLDDNSIEAYLYQKTKTIRADRADTIQAALSAIDEARDMVEALRQ